MVGTANSGMKVFTKMRYLIKSRFILLPLPSKVEGLITRLQHGKAVMFTFLIKSDIVRKHFIRNIRNNTSILLYSPTISSTKNDFYTFFRTGP